MERKTPASDPREGVSSQDEARYRELFAQMDTDKSGHISRAEFLDAVSTLGLHVSPDRAHQVFQARADGDMGNGDGLVSYPEFVRFASARDRELRQLFVGLDGDGDGRLTHGELTRALEVLEQEDAQARGGAPGGARLGPSPSMGREGKPEAVPSGGKGSPLGGKLTQTTDSARLTDGKAGTAHGESAPLYKRAAVDQLFARMDVDADGSISWDEFRNFLRLLPAASARELFDTWTRASIDPGENARIPEDLPPAPRGQGQPPRPLASTLLAGGVAGGVSRVATAPLDRIKVILQAGTHAPAKTPSLLSTSGPSLASAPPPPRPSIPALARHIYRTEGVAAFFRGNGANCIKIVPESAVKFLAYDSLKHLVSQDPDRPGPAGRFIAGAAAGMISQGAVYPLEVAKTRLALAPAGMYRGIGGCLAAMWRAEGPRSLYRGLLPSMLGIIPYAGTDLAVYNTLRDAWVARHAHAGEAPGAWTIFACGAISSTCGQLVSYPLQVVRTRLQMQGLNADKSSSSSGGFLSLGRSIVRQEGVLGLYRGLGANFVKTIPSVGISYALFETVAKFLDANKTN